MATQRRFVRCPQCKFEHVTFGEPVVKEGTKVHTPWRCPKCKWWGDFLDDRTMTQNPPPPAK